MPCQHRCAYCYVEALKYVYSVAGVDPRREVAQGAGGEEASIGRPSRP
jgi:DNA repair photolyase